MPDNNPVTKTTREPLDKEEMENYFHPGLTGEQLRYCSLVNDNEDGIDSLREQVAAYKEGPKPGAGKKVENEADATEAVQPTQPSAFNRWNSLPTPKGVA